MRADLRGYVATMPSLQISVPSEELRPGLDKIRRDFEVPTGFPADVEEEAEEAARSPSFGEGRNDVRDVPFVTIDPPGSRDLDQAFFASRRDAGFRVQYAIADLAPFVRPGGTVDAEAWRRGQTIYMPDARSPLHPTVISEGAASLLPDTERAALLWTVDLDESGDVAAARLERAIVRSRRAMSYEEAQSALDAGRADEPLRVLRDVGRLREAAERERDGISLHLPRQQVVPTDDGYGFSFEAPLPVEEWNAQISLLAGHCAARIMVDGGVGILRTLPAVRPGTLARLRRVADALDIEWSNGMSLGEILRTQNGRSAESAAFLTQATHALRGAGYDVVDPAAKPSVHGALGMIYAHVTAPLRRLVDRYANEVVLALCADRVPPTWASDALARLPEAMADADRRADEVEAAVLNLAESVVLAAHVGRTFRATVVDEHEGQATIQLRRPPVVAKLASKEVKLGERVEVRIVAADPLQRTVSFEVA